MKVRWLRVSRFRFFLPGTLIANFAQLSRRRDGGAAFVAFNGDNRYSDNTPGEFAGYFVELRAHDYPEFPGGGLQVGVVGSPAVSALEEWIDAEHQWSTIWSRSPSG